MINVPKMNNKNEIKMSVRKAEIDKFLVQNCAQLLFVINCKENTLPTGMEQKRFLKKIKQR